MSDDDDVLGWLEDGDDGGNPAVSADSEEEFQDALDWLQDSEEEDSGGGGGGAAPASGSDDAGLDWLGGGEDEGSAPALLADDEDEDEPQASIFTMALDDFFEGMEQSEEAQATATAQEADQTIQTRKKRKRRSADDQRIDKVVTTLVRYLTRKDPVRESQLDTIFRLTVGKIVDPISAEVIIVYFLDEAGDAHFAHLFYSRSLFKNHAGLEERFNNSLQSLGQLKIPKGQGLIGKAIDGRKAITSLDASNDTDFLNHLGNATGYRVRTMLTLPIMDAVEGDDAPAFGAIQVMNKDPNCGEEFFSYTDLQLMTDVCNYLGRMIHLVRNPDLERTDEEVAGYYAKMAKTTIFDPETADVEWDDRLMEVVGKDAITRWKIIPIKKLDSKNLQVVMVNPMDMTRRSNFEAATELLIGEAFVATEAVIDEIVEKIFGKQEKKVTVDESEFGSLTAEFGGAEKVEIAAAGGESEDEESAPIIKLVNRIIEDAYSRGASDIHIEPYETFGRVRYRVDGALSERMRLPRKALPNVAARIKIMSNLDISEKRLPQDGKIKFKKFSRKGLDIDLRVATGPMAFGEKTVMRILAKGSISLGLDAMGFSDENLAKYRWACTQPYGMILNVGPTGSGKTTTLYSGLSEVNSIDVNIQTAEDPIEYPLDGINQMQMLKTIGLDFARALRCYMRMDPDIILVGEIRDLETAEIAIEASLTGHLLFSTLHTNDAAGTCSRFMEMGIEPFMISSSLLVCCAQRLLRRTCDKCRQPWEPSEKEMSILMRDPRDIDPAKLTKHLDNRGKKKVCNKCNGIGYKGRVGTHEVMSLNDDLRRLINEKASANIIKKMAVQAGMKTIFQDALFKVKEGITDLPDVMARVKADEVEGAKQSDVLTLDD
jgi:type IV pilus assembly protein PilB